MSGYGANASDRRYTVEEFERLPGNDGYRTELSRGRLVREPPPGVQLVWVVHPRNKTVAVHRSGTDVEVLTEADALRGGEVLPGFTLPLAELFARPT